MKGRGAPRGGYIVRSGNSPFTSMLYPLTLTFPSLHLNLLLLKSILNATTIYSHFVPFRLVSGNWQILLQTWLLTLFIEIQYYLNSFLIGFLLLNISNLSLSFEILITLQDKKTHQKTKTGTVKKIKYIMNYCRRKLSVQNLNFWLKQHYFVKPESLFPQPSLCVGGGGWREGVVGNSDYFVSCHLTLA